MKINAIISVSGFGYCGTTAVVDILRSFSKEIDITEDIEYQILYFPDGISDLDYKLNVSFNRYYDCDVAITRFLDYCEKYEFFYPSSFHGKLRDLAEEYIDSLISMSWTSLWTYDRLNTPHESVLRYRRYIQRIDKWNSRAHFVNRILRKFGIPKISIKANRECYKKRRIYMSVCPDGFIEKTHLFLSATLEELASKQNAKYTLLRQFLPPGFPSRYYKYLPYPVKTIVVSRDPRDLYVLAKQKDVLFIPHDNVENFIIWYRENFKAECMENNPDVLRLQFEDLIFDYDNQVRIICEYLNLDVEQVTKKWFNPDKSSANTRMFLSEKKLESDIQVIEQKLPEYLYQFK